MESKTDVFEELLDAYDEAVSQNGNLHPTAELLDYDERYHDAQETSDIKLPYVVGLWLKIGKQNQKSLINALTMEYSKMAATQLSQTELQQITSWIKSHNDDFAKAWLFESWNDLGTNEHESI